MGELLFTEITIFEALKRKSSQNPAANDKYNYVDVKAAASHRDLEKMSADGDFRSDLYHRLSVFKIVLPPLRTAKQDLEELVPALVAEYNVKSGRKVSEISTLIWEKLKQHDWRGNVRELRNVH